jgi:hypothetical protein
MSRSSFLSRLILMVLALFTSVEAVWSMEVHFVAREFRAGKPIWHTDTVLLERSLAGDEYLTFVLENPTSAEHAFVMPGAQRITREQILTPESSVDIPEPMTLYYTEPMTVTVKPGERRLVKVLAAGLLAPKSAGQAFRYYCEIHKDVHLAGSIYVM